MLSQTSRKRLHSALQEPSITTGWKRTRHEVGSRQPAMITETEAFISGNSDLESQSRNKAKDTKAQRPNDLTHPRPYSAQVSGRDDRAPEGYKLAPGIIFTPHPVVASDYGPSSTRRWPSKNSRIRGAPREPVSELSENSSGAPTNHVTVPSSPRTVSDYKSDSDIESESDESTSARADNVAAPSSPRTVSDYRSGSNTESEPESGDRSTSTCSPSSPSASHYSTLNSFNSTTRILGTRSDNAAVPSSPKTVSDYRSDFETELESDSGDRSTSTRSTSLPSAFHCSTIPLPDSSDLKSRLGSFLPAIRAANESLERERAEGRIASWNIEVVDKDVEQYIEMNLGLGVLEEKKPRDISWRLDESESASESENESESEILSESDDESTSSSESSSESESQSDDDQSSSEEEDDDACTSESSSESESDSDSESESESKSDSDSEHEKTRKKQKIAKHHLASFLRTKPPQPKASKRRSHQETNYIARLMGQHQPQWPAPKKPMIEVLPID